MPRAFQSHSIYSKLTQTSLGLQDRIKNTILHPQWNLVSWFTCLMCMANVKFSSPQNSTKNALIYFIDDHIGVTTTQIQTYNWRDTTDQRAVSVSHVQILIGTSISIHDLDTAQLVSIDIIRDLVLRPLTGLIVTLTALGIPHRAHESVQGFC